MQGDVFRREQISGYPDWMFDYAPGSWALDRWRAGTQCHQTFISTRIYGSALARNL